MKARAFLLFFPTIAAAAIIAGCSHEAVPPATVAALPPASVAAPIPGRFAYRLDPASLARMNATNTVKGFVCGADSIPINAEPALRQAIEATLPLLFAHVEPAAGPLNPANLRRSGLDGLITVTVEQFQPEVRFRQKILSGPDAEAQADLALAVSVAGPEGPIVTSRSGGGQSLNYPGGGCAGGAMALGEATGRAIRLALDRMTSQLAENRALRLASSRNAPAIAASAPPRDITNEAFETPLLSGAD